MTELAPYMQPKVQKSGAILAMIRDSRDDCACSIGRERGVCNGELLSYSRQDRLALGTKAAISHTLLCPFVVQNRALLVDGELCEIWLKSTSASMVDYSAGAGHITAQGV
jgi:hypothetical protein